MTKKDQERLINLKIKKKRLEEQIKGLEAVAMNEEYDEIVGANGKVQLQARKNYKIPSNVPIIDYMGQNAFNERAKISASEITKAIGEEGFDELLIEGAVLKGKDTRYYKLTEF